jgi:hypothetical protein
MYFKLQLILNPLFVTIREEQPVTLTFGDKQNTTVLISEIDDEQRQRYRPGSLLGTAVTQRDTASDIQEIFVRFADDLMPKGFKPSKEHQAHKQIDAEGRIKKGYAVSRDLFPKPFQEFASGVHHDLSESIKHAVKIVRWRMGSDSSHNPIASSRAVSWSFDNQSWHPLPGAIHVEIEPHVCPQISPRLQGEIEGLIQSDEKDPLGYELFLEAWELRKNNPRSALIIGMSAAEVGLKQCIGKLVPEAEWLAIEVQAPPLPKMLSEYLPQLPAKLNIEGKVLTPSKRIRTAIHKGTEARNRSAHRGAEPPDRLELKELLLCIRDLLYLLDFYCGYEWALEQIRDEIRQEMVTEFDLKSTRSYSLIDLG